MINCATFKIKMKWIFTLALVSVLAITKILWGATLPTQADVQALTQQLQRQNQIQQRALDEELRIKNRPTDFPPPSNNNGALSPGFLGLTCKAARERMRWREMPCAWDQPRGYTPYEIDPEPNQ